MKTSQKIGLICCGLVMTALIILGICTPPQVYITGVIPSMEKTTSKWVKYKGEWCREVSIPVVISNEYRGGEITAYVDQDRLLVGDETFFLTNFKDSYPPSKNKPVYVAMRQANDGYVITRATLDKNYFNGDDDPE